MAFLRGKPAILRLGQFYCQRIRLRLSCRSRRFYVPQRAMIRQFFIVVAREKAGSGGISRSTRLEISGQKAALGKGFCRERKA